MFETGPEFLFSIQTGYFPLFRSPGVGRGVSVCFFLFVFFLFFGGGWFCCFFLWQEEFQLCFFFFFFEGFFFTKIFSRP